MAKKESSKIIEEEDFRLTHSHYDKWDLIFAKIVHANDPEKRRSEFKKVDAYGIDIPTAHRKIANKRLINDYEGGDIVLSLEEYIVEFKDKLQELKFLLDYKDYGKE